MKEPKRIIRIQLVTREQKSQPNSARPLQELLNKFLEKMNLAAEYCPRVYSVRGLNFKLHTKMDKPDNQPDMVLVSLDTLVNDGDISIKAVKQDYPKMLFTGLSSTKTKQSVMNMGYDGYLPTLFNQMNLKELFKDKSKIDLDKLPVVDELEKDDHRPNRTPSTSTVHSDNGSDHRHWNNNGKHGKFNRNNRKDNHKFESSVHDSDHKSQDKTTSSDWTEVKHETFDHKSEESVQSKFTDVKSEQIESKKESADSDSVKASLDTTHKLENKPESSVTDTANTDKQAEENSNTEVNKDYSEGSGNKTSDKPTDKDQTDAKSEESEKNGFAVKVDANGEQKLDQDDYANIESDHKSEDTDAKSDDSDHESDKSDLDKTQETDQKSEDKKSDDASLEDDFENINFDDVSGDGIELNIPDHQSEEKDAGKDNSDNESDKSDEKDKHETDDHQAKPFNVLADLKKNKDDTGSKSENADHDGKFTDKKSEKDSALEGLSKIMNGGKKPKNDDFDMTGSGNDTPLAPDQGAGDTDTKRKKKDWTLDRPIHDSKSSILGDDNDDGDLDQLQKILNHEVVMDDSSNADDQNQEND